MSATENYNANGPAYGKHEPNFAVRMMISRIGIDRWDRACGGYRLSDYWDALDRAFGDETLEPQGSPYSDDCDLGLSNSRLTCPCLALARKSPEHGVWREFYLDHLLRLKAAREAQLEAERVPF